MSLHDEYEYLVRGLDIPALPRMILIDQTRSIIYESKEYITSALERLEQKTISS